MKPTWQSDCGTVKLWLGDCLEVMEGWPTGAVDMVWTDPPFGHKNQDGDLQAARVHDGVKDARVTPAVPIRNDSQAEMRVVVDGMLKQAARFLAADCCCCCCCCMAGGGPTPTFAWSAERMDRKGLAFFQAVVWDKSARGNGLGWRYRRNYEFVMVAHSKGGTLAWNNGKAVPNIVRHCPPRNRRHPNEKPVEMVQDFISWHVPTDSLVADPFMGSGTTGVAAVRLDRHFWGVEIDEGYFEIAKNRIQDELDKIKFLEPPPKEPEQQNMFEATDD